LEIHGYKFTLLATYLSGVNEGLTIKSSAKHALLFGASGLVGSHCLQALLHHPAYKKVSAFYRRAPVIQQDKLVVHQVDMEKIGDWGDLIEGEDLFICLGTTMNKAGSKKAFYHIEYDYLMHILDYAQKKGVQQILLVSAMGADSSSLFFYNQVKGKIEEMARCMDFWAIHIFRPSLLIGSREEVRPLESFATGAGMALKLLGPKLFSKITPIEAEKVALSMVKAAQGTRSGVFYYPSHYMAKFGKSNSGNDNI
jgi:uncharacterized protein YbjT (DUF2867 family)